MQGPLVAGSPRGVSPQVSQRGQLELLAWASRIRTAVWLRSVPTLGGDGGCRDGRFSSSRARPRARSHVMRLAATKSLHGNAKSARRSVCLGPEWRWTTGKSVFGTEHFESTTAIFPNNNVQKRFEQRLARSLSRHERVLASRTRLQKNIPSQGALRERPGLAAKKVICMWRSLRHAPADSQHACRAH